MTSPDFSDLDRHVAEWGLETAHARLHKRVSGSLEEQQMFHAAIVPRLEAIIEFLNQFPLTAIPAEHLPLAYTALAVCEVDDAVSQWHAATLGIASDPRTWRVKEHFYDYQ